MRLFGQVKSKRRIEGAAAHTVVARAIAAADDHRELRHRRIGHGIDHLGAMLDDTLLFIATAHHESGDVLQVDQRRAGLVTELDELRCLQRGIREEHAIVAEDADREAVDMRVAGDQRRAIVALELLEARAIYKPRNHLTDLEWLARVGGYDAQQLIGIVLRLLRTASAARISLRQFSRATISRPMRIASASSSAR